MSSLEDEDSDPEEGQSSEQQVALTWLINSSAQNPQNKRPGVVPAASCALCHVPHAPLEGSLPCPVCRGSAASAQCHKTLPCPGPAGPARLPSAIPGLWEKGGRQQGVGAEGPGSPWCSLIKHTATSCAGHGGRAGKSPRSQAHV